MNESFKRALLIRKLIYLGCIVLLFTVSMFWRGKISLPFGNADRAAAAYAEGNSPSLADRIAGMSIIHQADRLEMRELDLGDPEIASSVANVSLVGVRGAVVSVMWYQAMKAQTRAEYDKFELLARSVTRLQPHFEEPWVYQAWNISYNVSVESDKLGDAFFYIARGIELLAEGDRLNTKPYRGVMVGSPYMRFQIGFFYQNKFSVSDKVNTMRSLMQLAVMKPTERDPNLFIDSETDIVDMNRFKTFCEKNPQLVRRLNTNVNCRTPRDVIDFLRVNRNLPGRYRDDGSERKDQLKDDEKQYPALPLAYSKEAQPRRIFATGNPWGEEYSPSDITLDDFDALHASRAWFEYAQMVVPPPVFGKPMMSPKPAQPGRKPRDGEYDQYRYRIPPRPSTIIFRQQPCRAQTYIAERLQKEGWFDLDTAWTPRFEADAGTRVGPVVVIPPLKIVTNKAYPNYAASDSMKYDPLQWKPADPRNEPYTSDGKSQWRLSHDQWSYYGAKNGFNADPEKLEVLALQTVHAFPGLPHDAIPLPNDRTVEDIKKLGMTVDEYNALKNNTPNYTDEELTKKGVTREQFDARIQLGVLRQNRRLTNYEFFFRQTEAEMSDEVTDARKMLAEAERIKTREADIVSAIRVYAEGCALFRKALAKYPKYHYMQQNDTAQEQLAEYELTLAKLLLDDPKVVAKARTATDTFRTLVPMAPQYVSDDWKNVLAENAALALIVNQMKNPALDARVDAEVQLQLILAFGPQLAQVMASNKAIIVPFKDKIRQQLIDGEFQWMLRFVGRSDGSASSNRAWVASMTMDRIKEKMGLLRKPPPPPPEPQAGVDAPR